MKRPIGRPRHILICDQRPGEFFTVPQAAALARVGETAIPAAVRRGRPTGPDRIVFRKALPEANGNSGKWRLTSNGYSMEPWDGDDVEQAFERYGDEATEIVFGKNHVDYEQIEVLGIPIRNQTIDDNWCFEDTQCALHCIIALMLNRNPIREEFFGVCREVLPKLEISRSHDEQ